ncbi:MAG TPA: aminoglycoside phosphotransferase family protein [Deinococcales bacterium]|nr:aminoglycoside phosphotransferase family protein [Deinococcales bacterium]
MRVEPPLDRAALLASLLGTHGLALDALAFIPQGMAAAYRAQGPSGTFFVKVFPGTPTGRELAARLPAETGLLRALRERGVLGNVPEVVPALDGAPTARFGTLPLVVQRFIPGRTLNAEIGPQLPRLAETLGRLHAGTPRLAGLPLPFPPEDLAFPWEGQLLADLAGLDAIGPGGGFGPNGLKALLGPRRPELLVVLARARELRGRALRAGGTPVVCHTDAHGWNLILDPAGKLWLIDWETARLAPPEHDLWAFGARLPEVLPAYAAARGAPAVPNADRLGFYLYRRHLEDIAAWVAQLLRDPVGDEQHAADLEMLERHGLGGWARLPRELEALRAAARTLA